MEFRYVIAIFTSIHFAIVYGLSVNLNIVIISMVNYTALESVTHEHFNETEDGPFVWYPGTQGLILSSFHWGFMLTQYSGGRLAELTSAKWIMFLAAFINIIGTLLTPICVKWCIGAFVIVRLIQGLGAGAMFPSVHVLLAYWAPPLERRTLASIIFAGTGFGILMSLLFSGLIANWADWEAVFYIEGTTCVWWLPFWVRCVHDNPIESDFITERERIFIKTALAKSTKDLSVVFKKRYKVPWKEVFTSPPFLALLIAHTGGSWAWYMLLLEIPQYMKHVLHFNIKSNAIFSALPYLSMSIFSIIFTLSLRYLRNHHKINTTTARKICTFTGNFTITSCLTVLWNIDSSYKVTKVIMILAAVTSTGAYFYGHTTNHLDLAPNFVGTLLGITKTIASLTGIIVPIFCGFLFEGDNTIKSWATIFITTSVICIIAMIVYTAYASAEVQPWNEESFGQQPPSSSHSTN